VESSPKRRTAVLGLGNVLMADDALGPYVIQVLLARYEFDEGVTVHDLGTPGLDLHPFLVDQNALVIVDTVRSKGAPGEMRLYRRDEILEHPPQSRVSPHDPGLKEALLSLEFSHGEISDMLLVGVVPEGTESTIGLSPPVQAAVSAVERTVVDELRRLGHEIVPRTPPGDPDLWWERDPSTRGDAP
jgi:hydrogenase maturation protease